MESKNLKILMIGNSFSISVGYFLPSIVKNDGKHTLDLTSAYIGGCTLDIHYQHLTDAEKDPELKPYLISIWKNGDTSLRGVTSMGNVNELLKNNQYDIVTIQQGSMKSWDPASYEPFAGELIKYIRKYQKNAEIIIQQTWSYRSDAPALKELALDQDTMYEKLRAAYKEFAERYALRMIPMGDAVQLYRQRVPEKYQAPEREFQYPEAPSAYGDLVGLSYWLKDENGGNKLITDTIHLNEAGQFTQAALWYAFIFGEPVTAAAGVFKDIQGNNDLELLLSCAADAMKKI